MHSPFSVIVPMHVANQLAMLPSASADKFRRELLAVAQLGIQNRFAEAPPPPRAQREVEENGFLLRYEVDYEHRAVVALELSGSE